jgi:hypothetical protein
VNVDLLLDTSIPLGDAVNQLLRPLIGPFKSTTAPVVSNSGQTTDFSSTVIHNYDRDAPSIPVDAVAAIVDCNDSLTREGLQTAYNRIKTVKAFQKSDRPEPKGGEVNMTTGIIIARTSTLTLEEISAELARLNDLAPSHCWPDAVAVIATGLINYAAYVPGTNKSGDFFLPAEATVARSPSPSVWVQMAIRPVADLTFPKIASLVVARVAIFQPGVKVADFRGLIKDMPTHGAATRTYQFNLANTLVAMTREQAIASQLPPDIFNIVSGKTKLGSIQYQSWQDGGVLIVRGKFPIEPFLIFLRQVVPELPVSDLQYFRGSDVQVSYVLPITQQQFFQTLSIFQSRSSNISVKKEMAKILMQKIGDEGTRSPFVARLMMGILGIRDAVYGDNNAAREHFDELYDQVLSGLRNARETSTDIAREWEQHRAKVESGAIVNARGRAIHVSESIDRSLKRDLESFLNTAVRVIKQSLQTLMKDLAVDIGFLFQKESAFQAGVLRIRDSHPVLAEYLIATRVWTEPLILMRNNLEHGTISSPKVSYLLESSPVTAQEPIFGGRPITEFTTEVLDRICCFVEEMTVFGLQKKLPPGFEIAEVPPSERDPIAPQRFGTTVIPGGRKPWVLTAHVKKFSGV